VSQKPSRFSLALVLALGAASGLLLSLAGCATPPKDPAARAEFEATNDPIEPTNRAIFGFNMFLDTWLIKPVAQSYKFIVPQFGRNRIHDFLQNLDEPVIFANDMMQGEWHAADVTAGRFLANTTWGIGGLFDLAQNDGLKKQSGDFGQTLYHYGVGNGPYLVLPILGPSDPRDAIGYGVDSVMDPFGWVAWHFGHGGATWYRWAAEGIDERSRHIQDIEELQKNSIDFYAAIRSLWRQHRAAELRHNRFAPMPNMDFKSMYDDPSPLDRTQTSLDIDQKK
jgi:phospholipid-binding lipoprotein MlaA